MLSNNSLALKKLKCADQHLRPLLEDISKNQLMSPSDLTNQMKSTLLNCMIFMNATTFPLESKQELMREIISSAFTDPLASSENLFRSEILKIVFLENLKTWGISLDENFAILLKFYKEKQNIPFCIDSFLRKENASLSQCNFLLTKTVNHELKKEIISYLWGIYNKTEEAEKVDLVLFAGDDSPNQNHMESELFVVLEHCIKQNITLFIAHKNNLRSMPQSENFVLWAHGERYLNHNNLDVENNLRDSYTHQVTLFNRHIESVRLLKELQTSIGFSKLLFLACYGASIITEFKKNQKNSLAPGTVIFAPSPEDDVSSIGQNIQCLRIFVNLIKKNKVFPILKYVQNIIESIPETSTLAYFAANNTINSITFRLNDKLKNKSFINHTKFCAYQIKNLHQFIDDCIKGDLNHLFRQHLDELVLNDNRAIEKNVHVIENKRSRKAKYLARSNLYKNQELLMHAMRKHTVIMEHLFQNQENKNRAHNLLIEILKAIFDFNAPLGKAGNEIQILIKHGANVFAMTCVSTHDQQKIQVPIIDVLINYEGIQKNLALSFLIQFCMANSHDEAYGSAFPYILSKLKSQERSYLIHQLFAKHINVTLTNLASTENNLTRVGIYYFTIRTDNKNHSYCEMYWRDKNKIHHVDLYNTDIFYQLLYFKIFFSDNNKLHFNNLTYYLNTWLNPNAHLNHLGYSILMAAIENNKPELVSLLLSKGTNYLEKDYSGNNIFEYDTYLILPTIFLKLKMLPEQAQNLLKLVLEDKFILTKFVYIKPFLVHLMLHGAPVNTYADDINHAHYSLLWRAVALGDHDFVKFLLKNGANSDIKNSESSLINFCFKMCRSTHYPKEIYSTLLNSNKQPRNQNQFTLFSQDPKTEAAPPITFFYPDKRNNPK